MSNVYKSARRPTKLEVFVYATDLTEALLSACHNSNVIPKSYRYDLSANMLEKVFKLYEDVYSANSIYPKGIDTIKMRTKFQKDALIQIELLLQYWGMVNEIFKSIPNGTNQHIAELMVSEENLLKGWIKSDKK